MIGERKKVRLLAEMRDEMGSLERDDIPSIYFRPWSLDLVGGIYPAGMDVAALSR